MCGLDVALLKKCNVPLLWNKCSAFFVLSIHFFGLFCCVLEIRVYKLWNALQCKKNSHIPDFFSDRCHLLCRTYCVSVQ